MVSRRLFLVIASSAAGLACLWADPPATQPEPAKRKNPVPANVKYLDKEGTLSGRMGIVRQEFGSHSPADRAAEQAARTYGPQTLREFSQRTQPILFNSCAASACHGSKGTSSFRLTRPASTGTVSAALTQQNLRETLRWIDQEKPEASALLKKALEPHGTPKRSPLPGPQSPLYQSVEKWVRITVSGKGITRAGFESSSDSSGVVRAVGISHDQTAPATPTPPVRQVPVVKQKLPTIRRSGPKETTLPAQIPANNSPPQSPSN